MRIGVFDSGIGGEAVAASLALSLPDAIITTVNDKTHVPYGDRDQKDIIMLTDAALQPLLGNQDIIVIACNSATAAAIEWLRTTYPNQLFVGLEPMVKPAVEQSRSGIIAVCATPATLASSRYMALKKKYLGNTICLEPNCRNWASMIETSTIDHSIIEIEINDVIQSGADVIVLACTHYHWIRSLIEDVVKDRAIVLDPSQAIAKRIISLMKAQ
jgi:glutamate racemase